MKKIRRILMIVCAISLVFVSTIQINAYERDEHDKQMLEVLFKNFKEVDNDKFVKDDVKALECACYLAIDQFNSKGQKALDTLKEYGVKDLPESIAEINITDSPSKHRSHTHRGWDFPYPGEKGDLWIKRRNILINTVGTVFDFDEDVKKQEAFSKFLYYIHVLGDHIDDTSYKINNGLKMEVGGRIDQEDIIHEWLDSMKVVFADQKHTHKYTSLTSALSRYNSRFSKIIRSEGGVNTEKKFEKHKEYSIKLMKLMKMYIPEMLKNEPFFNQVFYK